MSTERTVDQWLAIPEDDLPTELGRLTPGPWVHRWRYNRCKKCNVTLKEGQFKCCSVPDPIDIKDWNVATKWARKHFGEGLLLYMKQMWEWSGYELEMSFPHWLLAKAQPKHYLIAAAMARAKERKKNG